MKPMLRLLAAALLTAATGHAAELIVNGGFESPALGGAGIQENVALSGWTGFGNIVPQGYNGSVVSGDGEQWLDLSPGTHIQQTVTLSGSPVYVLSFLYNGGEPRLGLTAAISYFLSTPNSLIAAGLVSAESMNVFAGTPWARFTHILALGPEPIDMTVRFDPNFIGTSGFIDNVSIVAVPEPATSGMVGLGLACLVGILKRRASTARRQLKRS